MRVYFEKPRTVTGWKGFIQRSAYGRLFHIEEGMERARRFSGRPRSGWACPPPRRRWIRPRRSTSGILSPGTRSAPAPANPRRIGENGQRSFGAGGVQERDRRQYRHRDQCHNARTRAAYVLGITADGTRRSCAPRQRLRAYRVARRPEPEITTTAQVALTEQELAQGQGSSPIWLSTARTRIPEEAGTAAAGVQGLHPPDHRRQQLHHWPDAGEQHRGGQPADSRRTRRGSFTAAR